MTVLNIALEIRKAVRSKVLIAAFDAIVHSFPL